MAKEIKDVQQLINDKAALRLKKDVDEIANYVYNGKAYDLCKGLAVNVGTSESPKMIAISSIFNSDGFRQNIIEINIERYQSEEAAAFIEKLESVKTDVDNLMAGNYNQDY